MKKASTLSSLLQFLKCFQVSSLVSTGGSSSRLQTEQVSTDPPHAAVDKPFLLSEGRVELEASLDKATYHHGEPVTVTVTIRNNSGKTVRRIKVRKRVELTLGEVGFIMLTTFIKRQGMRLKWFRRCEWNNGPSGICLKFRDDGNDGLANFAETTSFSSVNR